MVTLNELLSVPGLKLSPLHLTAADTDVRWVATSELTDPTPYLEGGEVLLTTGLETLGWGAEWRDYVQRLVDAGVAGLGLGLGVGLTHARTPKPLVHACEDLGLNLFAVPRRTTFVSISRTAAGMLEAARAGVARRALDAQRALTQAALEADDEATLVRRLAKLVGGAATIVTRDGEPIDGPHSDPGLALDDVRSTLERIQAQGMRAAASSSTASGTTVVRPLGVRGRPEAWLAVFVPGLTSDADRVAIATAGALLSLSLERRHERRATGRQLRSRAIELLLANDVRTARIVLGATALTGADPKLPREVRLIRARGPQEAIDDALTSLEDRRILATILDDELAAISRARTAGIPELLANFGLQVGVGRTTPLEESALSYKTAGHALATTSRTTPVQAWDDLTATGVLGLLGTERTAAFARTFLAPLRSETVLLETLATFLQHHGSHGETATELGVHRNTIRNRINHIETLLGASLTNPQTRVDTWIALQANR